MTAPIVITGTVVGVDRVAGRLAVAKPAAARARLKKAIQKLGYQLERQVRTKELNGRVLKRRSGTLARSINTRFTEGTNEFTASVGTALFYGRIWELTGSKAFVQRPSLKRALFWKGARHPVRSVLHPAQAPRPFLRPALQDMRATIQATLSAAMRAL